MPNYFFKATEGAHAQLTKLYDFVWPTASAMWNLRWQVAGYLQAVPNATVEQLKARFTEGADIHGANLKRACVEHSWDEQKENFARILLVNTIAVYEGWIDEVLDSLGKKTRELTTALQFPNSTAKDGKGAAWAIAQITNPESSALKAAFYPVLSKGRYFALQKLDALLLCYRLFKELRNCDMHGGGIATQRLLDAYSQFAVVANSASLGVAEVPVHHPAALGGKVKLSLRGVVGFSHLVLKLIDTIDAELSRSQAAERVFVKQWQVVHSRRLNFRLAPGKPKNRVKKAVMKAGFPRPEDPETFGIWLRGENLVDY